MLFRASLLLMVGAALVLALVSAAPGELLALDSRASVLLRRGDKSGLVELRDAQGDPAARAVVGAYAASAGGTLDRIAAMPPIDELLAQATEPSIRALLLERRAGLRAQTGNYVRAVLDLERAAKAFERAGRTRDRLRCLLAWSDLQITHSLHPGRARGPLLEAAGLADQLRDEASARRVQRGLDAWANRSAQTAHLSDALRGSVDWFEFRDDLTSDGGRLFVARDQLLYVLRRGLTRFDGVFLEHLDDVPSAPFVRDFVIAPDGRVAAGSLKGIYTLEGQTWRRLPIETNGELADDGRGGWWIGVPGAAVRWQDGEVERVELPPAPGNEPFNFAVLDSAVWITHRAGVIIHHETSDTRLESGRDVFDDAREVVVDGEARWVLSTYGAERFESERRRDALNGEAITRNPSVRSLKRMSDGALWLGLGRGLGRESDGVLRVLTGDDRFEQVFGLAEWPESTVWFLNQTGALGRVTWPPRATTYDRSLLPSGWIYDVQPQPGGRLRLATGSGVAELDPASLEVLHYADDEHCYGIAPDVLPMSDGRFAVASYEMKCVAVTGANPRLYRTGAGLPDGKPYALARHRGELCVGMTTGLYCGDPLRPVDGVETLSIFDLQSVGDELLISARERGVFRLGDTLSPVVHPALVADVNIIDTGREILLASKTSVVRWDEGELRPVPALPSGMDVYSGTRTADGRLLLGSPDHGLIVSDGEDWTALSTQHGLPSNELYSVVQASDGTIWVGTGGAGLTQLRWDDGDPPETMIVVEHSARFVDPRGATRSLRTLNGRAPQPDERRLSSLAGEFVLPRQAWVPVGGSARVEGLAQLASSGEDDDVPQFERSTIEVGVAAVTPFRGLKPDEHLYRYRVDGGPWRGVRNATKIALSGLGNGEHTLEVSAKGHLLNRDPTPARLRFAVSVPLPAFVWPSLLGLLGLLGGWQRRRLRSLYLRMRHYSYAAIPAELFEPLGPIADPAQLYGRDELFERLEERLARARHQGVSVLLFGPPQAGRTSVLHCMPYGPRDVTAYLDINTVGRNSVDDLLTELSESIDSAFTARSLELRPSEDSGLRTPSVVITGMELTKGSPYRMFERLLAGASDSLPDGALVLRIDNAERLARIARDDTAYGGYLMPFLRGVVASAPRLLLVLTFSDDRARVEETFRELFVISTVLQLDPIGDEDAHHFFSERSPEHFALTPERSGALNHLAGGHPWLLERLARTLTDQLRVARRNYVVRADVNKAMGALLDQPMPSLAGLWAALTVKARLTLALRADAHEEDIDLDELGSRARDRQAPLLEEELRRLCNGLVRDRVLRADLSFVSDLFRRWIRKEQPLTEVLEQARDFVASYQVLDTLGEGGMGVVYKGRDMITGRVVALKVMARHLHTNEEAKKRFSREAELTMRLRHDNIVRTFDRGEHEGHMYIALEYLEGETIRDAVKREGPLEPEQALRIARDVASALVEVHAAGIIHRDLKSDNIMLVGEARVPKLTDFGLAYGEDMSVMTQSGHLIGTMAYMSPEQVSSEDAVPGWDLYSLGAVLYEMLTSNLPYSGREALALMRAIAYDPVPSPRARRPAVPAEADALVMKMLAKDPSARFGSAEEVLGAIENVLE